MSALAKLKLITAKKPTHMSPIVQRRNKLINRIYEQILLAQALQDGKSYAPTWQHTVKDETTGETKIIQTPKRLKAWWFESEAGKLCVSIKYGSKIIELGAKGKTAVEIANTTELVPTLETLKVAVANGELDTQIEAVSRTVKSTVKK